MANPSRYTGVPGFNVSEKPNEPPPPSKSPLQRPFAPKTDNTTIVTLRGVSVSLTSDVGCAFITDLSRNKERLFSDQRVREKYDIAETAWTAITQSKAVRLAVNAEHERRTLNGTAAQESAAQIFTEAPEVLGSILRDNKASPRHRIEASKELRTTANVGADQPSDAAEHVIITINLGADEKLVYDCGPPKHPKEPLDADADQW